MEGNFYVSDKVVDLEIASHYSRAYAQCRPQAEAYGRCVEGGQINRALKKNICEEQRHALRECVKEYLEAKKTGLTSSRLRTQCAGVLEAVALSTAHVITATSPICGNTQQQQQQNIYFKKKKLFGRRGERSVSSDPRLSFDLQVTLSLVFVFGPLGVPLLFFSIISSSLFSFISHCFFCTYFFTYPEAEERIEFPSYPSILRHGRCSQCPTCRSSDTLSPAPRDAAGPNCPPPPPPVSSPLVATGGTAHWNPSARRPRPTGAAAALNRLETMTTETSHAAAARRRRRRKCAAPQEVPAEGPGPTPFSSLERPYAGGSRLRPAASTAQQRLEGERLFPETLPSGRPAQQYTVSQRLFYAAHSDAAAKVQEQLAADRLLLEEERKLRSRRGADFRFFRRWSDYREIQDPDPLRGEGKLFGESKATAQLRTAAWQAQFEKENEDVFLPYERDTTLRKLAPNWFVRYFVHLRDSGGADHLHHLVVIGVGAATLLWLVGYLFYTAPARRAHWTRCDDQYNGGHKEEEESQIELLASLPKQQFRCIETRLSSRVVSCRSCVERDGRRHKFGSALLIVVIDYTWASPSPPLLWLMTATMDSCRGLQVFQQDLIELVSLPSRMVLHSYSWTRDAQLSTHSRYTGSSSSGAALDAVVDGLVTGAYLRQMVQDAVVRVRIPPKKRAALLHGNPYIKMLCNAFEKQYVEQQQKEQQSAAPSPSSAAPNALAVAGGEQLKRKAAELAEEQYMHRVGRLVGLFLKPSVAPGGEPQSSTSSGTADASTQALSPTSWLVAVHLGEMTETFPLGCVSADPMREEEHTAWTRSALHQFTVPGAASRVPQQHGVIFLDPAAGTALQQRLETVRRVLAIVRAAESHSSTSTHTIPGLLMPSVAGAAALAQRDGGLDPDEAEENRTASNAEAAEDSRDGEKASRKRGRDAPLAVEGETGMAAKVRRLERLAREKEEQLAQFRLLVAAKDAEIKRMVQQRRQLDVEHAEAARRDADKLREAAAQRQRAEQEREAAMQQVRAKDDVAEQLHGKIKRVAEVVKLYKGVYDDLVDRLLPASPALLRAADQPVAPATKWKVKEVQDILAKAAERSKRKQKFIIVVSDVRDERALHMDCNAVQHDQLISYYFLFFIISMALRVSVLCPTGTLLLICSRFLVVSVKEKYGKGWRWSALSSLYPYSCLLLWITSSSSSSYATDCVRSAAPPSIMSTTRAASPFVVFFFAQERLVFRYPIENPFTVFTGGGAGATGPGPGPGPAPGPGGTAGAAAIPAAASVSAFNSAPLALSTTHPPDASGTHQHPNPRSSANASLTAGAAHHQHAASSSARITSPPPVSAQQRHAKAINPAASATTNPVGGSAGPRVPLMRHAKSSVTLFSGAADDASVASADAAAGPAVVHSTSPHGPRGATSSAAAAPSHHVNPYPTPYSADPSAGTAGSGAEQQQPARAEGAEAGAAAPSALSTDPSSTNASTIALEQLQMEMRHEDEEEELFYNCVGIPAATLAHLVRALGSSTSIQVDNVLLLVFPLPLKPSSAVRRRWASPQQQRPLDGGTRRPQKERPHQRRGGGGGGRRYASSKAGPGDVESSATTDSSQSSNPHGNSTDSSSRSSSSSSRAAGDDADASLRPSSSSSSSSDSCVRGSSSSSSSGGGGGGGAAPPEGCRKCAARRRGAKGRRRCSAAGSPRPRAAGAPQSMLIVATDDVDRDDGAICRFVQCHVNAWLREEQRTTYISTQIRRLKRLCDIRRRQRQAQLQSFLVMASAAAGCTTQQQQQQRQQQHQTQSGNGLPRRGVRHKKGANPNPKGGTSSKQTLGRGEAAGTMVVSPGPSPSPLPPQRSAAPLSSPASPSRQGPSKSRRTAPLQALPTGLPAASTSSTTSPSARSQVSIFTCTSTATSSIGSSSLSLSSDSSSSSFQHHHHHRHHRTSRSLSSSGRGGWTSSQSTSTTKTTPQDVGDGAGSAAGADTPEEHGGYLRHPRAGPHRHHHRTRGRGAPGIPLGRLVQSQQQQGSYLAAAAPPQRCADVVALLWRQAAPHRLRLFHMIMAERRLTLPAELVELSCVLSYWNVHLRDVPNAQLQLFLSYGGSGAVHHRLLVSAQQQQQQQQDPPPLPGSPLGGSATLTTSGGGGSFSAVNPVSSPSPPPALLSWSRPSQPQLQQQHGMHVAADWLQDTPAPTAEAINQGSIARYGLPDFLVIDKVVRLPVAHLTGAPPSTLSQTTLLFNTQFDPRCRVRLADQNFPSRLQEEYVRLVGRYEAYLPLDGALDCFRTLQRPYSLGALYRALQLLLWTRMAQEHAATLCRPPAEEYACYQATAEAAATTGFLVLGLIEFLRMRRVLQVDSLITISFTHAEVIPAEVVGKDFERRLNAWAQRLAEYCGATAGSPTQQPAGSGGAPARCSSEWGGTDTVPTTPSPAISTSSRATLTAQLHGCPPVYPHASSTTATPGQAHASRTPSFSSAAAAAAVPVSRSDGSSSSTPSRGPGGNSSGKLPLSHPLAGERGAQQPPPPPPRLPPLIAPGVLQLRMAMGPAAWSQGAHANAPAAGPSAVQGGAGGRFAPGGEGVRCTPKSSSPIAVPHPPPPHLLPAGGGGSTSNSLNGCGSAGSPPFFPHVTAGAGAESAGSGHQTTTEGMARPEGRAKARSPPWHQQQQPPRALGSTSYLSGAPVGGGYGTNDVASSTASNTPALFCHSNFTVSSPTSSTVITTSIEHGGSSAGHSAAAAADAVAMSPSSMISLSTISPTTGEAGGVLHSAGTLRLHHQPPPSSTPSGHLTRCSSSSSLQGAGGGGGGGGGAGGLAGASTSAPRSSTIHGTALAHACRLLQRPNWWMVDGPVPRPPAAAAGEAGAWPPMQPPLPAAGQGSQGQGQGPFTGLASSISPLTSPNYYNNSAAAPTTTAAAAGPALPSSSSSPPAAPLMTGPTASASSARYGVRLQFPALDRYVHEINNPARMGHTTTGAGGLGTATCSVAGGSLMVGSPFSVTSNSSGGAEVGSGVASVPAGGVAGRPLRDDAEDHQEERAAYLRPWFLKPELYVRRDGRHGASSLHIFRRLCGLVGDEAKQPAPGPHHQEAEKEPGSLAQGNAGPFSLPHLDALSDDPDQTQPLFPLPHTRLHSSSSHPGALQLGSGGLLTAAMVPDPAAAWLQRLAGVIRERLELGAEMSRLVGATAAALHAARAAPAVVLTPETAATSSSGNQNMYSISSAAAGGEGSDSARQTEQHGGPGEGGGDGGCLSALSPTLPHVSQDSMEQSGGDSRSAPPSNSAAAGPEESSSSDVPGGCLPPPPAHPAAPLDCSVPEGNDQSKTSSAALPPPPPPSAFVATATSGARLSASPGVPVPRPNPETAAGGPHTAHASAPSVPSSFSSPHTVAETARGAGAATAQGTSGAPASSRGLPSQASTPATAFTASPSTFTAAAFTLVPPAGVCTHGATGSGLQRNLSGSGHMPPHPRSPVTSPALRRGSLGCGVWGTANINSNIKAGKEPPTHTAPLAVADGDAGTAHSEWSTAQPRLGLHTDTAGQSAVEGHRGAAGTATPSDSRCTDTPPTAFRSHTTHPAAGSGSGAATASLSATNRHEILGGLVPPGSTSTVPPSQAQYDPRPRGSEDADRGLDVEAAASGPSDATAPARAGPGGRRQRYVRRPLTDRTAFLQQALGKPSVCLFTSPPVGPSAAFPCQLVVNPTRVPLAAASTSAAMQSEEKAGEKANPVAAQQSDRGPAPAEEGTVAAPSHQAGHGSHSSVGLVSSCHENGGSVLNKAATHLERTGPTGPAGERQQPSPPVGTRLAPPPRHHHLAGSFSQHGLPPSHISSHRTPPSPAAGTTTTATTTTFRISVPPILTQLLADQPVWGGGKGRTPRSTSVCSGMSAYSPPRAASGGGGATATSSTAGGGLQCATSLSRLFGAPRLLPLHVLFQFVLHHLVAMLYAQAGNNSSRRGRWRCSGEPMKAESRTDVEAVLRQLERNLRRLPVFLQHLTDVHAWAQQGWSSDLLRRALRHQKQQEMKRSSADGGGGSGSRRLQPQPQPKPAAVVFPIPVAGGNGGDAVVPQGEPETVEEARHSHTDASTAAATSCAQPAFTGSASSSTGHPPSATTHRGCSNSSRPPQVTDLPSLQLLDVQLMEAYELYVKVALLPSSSPTPAGGPSSGGGGGAHHHHHHPASTPRSGASPTSPTAPPPPSGSSGFAASTGPRVPSVRLLLHTVVNEFPDLFLVGGGFEQEEDIADASPKALQQAFLSVLLVYISLLLSLSLSLAVCLDVSRSAHVFPSFWVVGSSITTLEKGKKKKEQAENSTSLPETNRNKQTSEAKRGDQENTNGLPRYVVTPRVDIPSQQIRQQSSLTKKKPSRKARSNRSPLDKRERDNKKKKELRAPALIIIYYCIPPRHHRPCYSFPHFVSYLPATEGGYLTRTVLQDRSILTTSDLLHHTISLFQRRLEMSANNKLGVGLQKVTNPNEYTSLVESYRAGDKPERLLPALNNNNNTSASANADLSSYHNRQQNNAPVSSSGTHALPLNNLHSSSNNNNPQSQGRRSGSKRDHDTAVSTDPVQVNPTAPTEGAAPAKKKQKVTYTLPHQNMEEGHFYVVLGEDIDVSTQRFKILSLLGEGTFGKVVEAWDRKRKEYCAVKIVRNVPKYVRDAKIEIKFMETVRTNDTADRYPIMKILRYFLNDQGHMCIVMPKYGPCLLDWIMKYGPFSHRHLAQIVFQTGVALDYFHTELHLMHTDLKPENILMETADAIVDPTTHRHVPPDPFNVRICDLGGCCDERHSRLAIVSTRHYRSPEVILGMGWMYSTDMWSMGCILYELYTGKLLYDTHENLEHLHLMEKTLGRVPPEWASRCGTEEARGMFQVSPMSSHPQLKPCTDPKHLARIARARPIRDVIRDDQLLDLITGLLHYDRSKRYTARQMSSHPYVLKHYPEAAQHPNYPTNRPKLYPCPLA
eukprot:gene623-343_t